MSRSPCHSVALQTGFYADQRDSRAVIRQLAAGRSVLDMCCFSGGFALSAAAGGALTALGVDSSAAAVELAGRNAELNGLQGVASFVRGDVADFMKQVGRVGCGVSVGSCLGHRYRMPAIAYLLGSAMLLRCAAQGPGCIENMMNSARLHAMLPCPIHPHRPWLRGGGGTWSFSTPPSWPPPARRWRRRPASTAASMRWPCRWGSGSDVGQEVVGAAQSRRCVFGNIVGISSRCACAGSMHAQGQQQQGATVWRAVRACPATACHSMPPFHVLALPRLPFLLYCSLWSPEAC